EDDRVPHRSRRLRGDERGLWRALCLDQARALDRPGRRAPTRSEGRDRVHRGAPVGTSVVAEQATRVIATAGHVDHGKSTLITALTGIDPDRLPQERERGMTIDLGFAWLRLPVGTSPDHAYRSTASSRSPVSARS